MPPLTIFKNIIAHQIQKGKREEEKFTAYQKKSKNPNMGRPTVNPKNNRLEIRLSDSESNMLDECVRRTGRNKTDVIVKGISMVYKAAQKKE